MTSETSSSPLLFNEIQPTRRSSSNGGKRSCSDFLESGSGVAHHDGGPLRLPMITLNVEAESQQVPYVAVRTIT